MAKAIDSELSLLRMDISHRTMSLDQLHNLLAVATTFTSEEVKANHLREQGISTVEADVQIEAKGNNGELTLQASVRVILKYKGDMVRISQSAKNKIKLRLQKLAQQCCAEEAYKIVIEASSSK